MRIRQAAALVIAALSGALWFAALDAILLFRAMPEPRLAGQLAANGFEACYWAVAAACLVGLVVSPRSRVSAALLLLIDALLLFWIVPALRAHGAGWPGSFASLHGSASLGHLLLGLGTVFWSWRLLTVEIAPPTA